MGKAHGECDFLDGFVTQKTTADFQTTHISEPFLEGYANRIPETKAQGAFTDTESHGEIIGSITRSLCMGSEASEVAPARTDRVRPADARAVGLDLQC